MVQVVRTVRLRIWKWASQLNGAACHHLSRLWPLCWVRGPHIRTVPNIFTRQLVCCCFLFPISCMSLQLNFSYHIRADPKVMPPLLLHWLMLVAWQQRSDLLTNVPLHTVAVWQMAAEQQSDKMVPDMEAKVCRWILHREPISIHWHLLNMSGDQAGYESSEAGGGEFQQRDSHKYELLSEQPT